MEKEVWLEKNSSSFILLMKMEAKTLNRAVNITKFHEA